MAQRNSGRLLIDDLRGGRNGYDPPTQIADNECVTADNVDWRSGKCVGRKRNGSAAVTLTNTGGVGAHPQWLYRYVPAATEGDAELWTFTYTAGTVYFRRLDGSASAMTTVTQVDAWTAGGGKYVEGATLNGKLFIAGDTDVNYLHLWDGSAFRRVGITVPAAPTAADTGSGSYAATIRYYKVAYTVQSGGATVRRSELSSALSFTPAGTGTAARVTKPAATSPACGETHWELYGSADNATYYLLATTVVGTTTYDDSTAPASYSGTGPPIVGTNTPPPSAKYVLAFKNRLIMAGAHETTGGETPPKNNRVWFTAVLGSSDVGDDERVPTNNYLDLSENSGDSITALAELFGDVYVFMSQRIWVLQDTGDVDAPFQAQPLSTVIGALNQRSLVTAEDADGRPALYFLSKRGVYRLGVGGLKYVGSGIEDLYIQTTPLAKAVNAHGVYHTDARQVWWWNIYNNLVYVYDTALDAWSTFSNAVGYATSSVMFANTLDASAMSIDLKPYIGGGYTHSVGNTVVKCDTGTSDAQNTGGAATATITATITLKPYALGGDEHLFRVSNPILTMTTGANITPQCAYALNYGAQTAVTDTGSAVAVGSETRTRIVFDGLQTAGVFAIQPTLSNTDTTGGGWTMDRLLIRYAVEEAAP